MKYSRRRLLGVLWLLLLAFLVLLTIFIGSLLGLVAFGRTRDLRRRVERLEAELRATRVPAPVSALTSS